jgi:ribosome-binding protein aMBF1 (putative translation factor)
MNLQPVFEAAEKAERATKTRRGWSIEELRERLGVAAPVIEKQETPKRRHEPETRQTPRIVKRSMACTMT